ncbi:Uncaracterized surface protein containing fasciclin (FAS1) repeats [Mesonia phycicola]|uniref:Uncaracterized surface protein containing fasciclin (FAS1) repeats n=1 Tax=Mesonia phycicola TaxID=579105 RepID=A0A1M6DZR1_9FLAO|nr:fasciclin domain-containing protein [Mesonia phycicola]SHI78623.1 Uncaracterized surface protein containing fasciclin (FAS1) repeats [Mesonia phycicola]
MMNKNILKIAKLLSLFGIIFLTFSCVDDDDNGNIINGTNSIVNYMDKNPRFSLFKQLIVKAELDGVLDGNYGTYTMLAPNNDAMQTYLNENAYDSVAQISSDLAYDLVNYHLLEALNTESTFVTSYLSSVSTVALTDSTTTNLSLLVTTEDGILFNGEVGIVEGDIDVDNGIFHEIDGVLDLPTLQTFLEADSNFSAFYNEAINTTSDFQDVLSSTDFHTLLVPSADAFTTFWSSANFTEEEKKQFFNYHIQDSLLTSDYLVTGYRTTHAQETIGNEDYLLNIYLNKDDGLIYNGVSYISVQDVVATNGVIHGLDETLSLPTLADFINADLDLINFQSSLTRTDQAGEDYINRLNTVNGTEAPFTIFAPIDTAFESALLELYPAEAATIEDIPTDSLTSILNNHLVTNNAYALENLPSVINTLKSQLQIAKTDSTFTLTDAQQRSANSTSVDIKAKNGILHKIDTLMFY